MADLTQGAIDALLGALNKAITDEAGLQGGLHGNMQFIKDEMDSMNGFLLHLTNTDSEHDHQIRAWMKQVRDIAYIAEDCVELYVRDIAPHDSGGPLSLACFLLLHPKKFWLRHKLAKKILELKVRVNDVGERRSRYGVQVPAVSGMKKAAEDASTAAKKEKTRDAFRRALEQAIADSPRAKATRVPLPSFIEEFIQEELPAGHAALVGATWKKCCPPPRPDPAQAKAKAPAQDTDPDPAQAPAQDDENETFLWCMRMLLCALYAYPYKSNNSLELERLKKKLEEEEEEGGAAEEIKKQVMIFCYSLLSIHQKSCLHYLTAFLEEKAISRTSLVRRWVAEGLVGKEGGRTEEEVGERYFNDLVFRGFIRPARIGDAGTVKSCRPLDGPIKDFITSIAASENFVPDLPDHLNRQLEIRKIVLRPPRQPPQQQPPPGCCRWSWRDVVGFMDDYCGCCCCFRDDKDPMDELVRFLKKLPALYRLNVLDLGGCKGLKPRHMEAIFTVVCLKYLSLRRTDVSWLPYSRLKKLKLLETLDIRETPLLSPGDVRRMYLKRLKHLLAGSYRDSVTGKDVPSARTRTASDDVLLVAMQSPRRIAEMTRMETLSHVQVSDDGAELGRIAKLRYLRKLGVVIPRANHRGSQQLRRVICALAGCLRSLSIWVTQDQGRQQGEALDIAVLPEATSSLVLENLDINGRIGSSTPSWLERAGGLANISLRNTEMSAGETLTRLARVLSLRCLKLSRRSFIEQALIFRDDVQFGKLRYLVVDGDTITRITFADASAAPELEKIVWSISKAYSGDLISGIDRLPKLKEIELRGNFIVSNLLQAIEPLLDPPVTKYRCRYVYLSDLNVIKEVKKSNSDAILSLPVGVINNNQQ